MKKKTIYCLDCEKDFYSALEKDGFETLSGCLGYRRGCSKFLIINEPPNECDVMIFNLTEPACFDMQSWGPEGGNDNNRCTIVNKVNKSMYYTASGLYVRQKYPRFRLIQRSQIDKDNTIFNYNHLQKAISEGGIDCIYYLNPKFMFHSLYDVPRWTGITFETDITKSRKWSVSENVSEINESWKKMGKGDLKLRNPIEFKLLDLRGTPDIKNADLTRIDLLVNNVNECLATIVKFGKGFIYFLPPFSNPVQATVKLIRDILPGFKQSYNELTQRPLEEIREVAQPSRKISEKIYGPGEQYLFYKDLKEIVKNAEKEVFIIDSYVNEDIFDLYVDKVKKGIKIRFLTKDPVKTLVTVINKFKAKPNIKFEARKTEDIHDRVIFIDEKHCWVVGHSIKDAAVKKPTYLLPIESLVDMKNLYETIWSTAKSI